jgi:hypothetical protein
MDHRRGDATGAARAVLRTLEGRRVAEGVADPVRRREHLILVFEAQPQREKDFPLGIHAAIHTFLDAMDRAKRDLGLSGELCLSHQSVFTQLANSILLNRLRFINFHFALLARLLEIQRYLGIESTIGNFDRTRDFFSGNAVLAAWVHFDRRAGKCCRRLGMRGADASKRRINGPKVGV